MFLTNLNLYLPVGTSNNSISSQRYMTLNRSVSFKPGLAYELKLNIDTIEEPSKILFLCLGYSTFNICHSCHCLLQETLRGCLLSKWKNN